MEEILFWTAIWLYGFSFVSYLYAVVFRKERGLRYGFYLVVAGFIAATASIAARWAATGHPPVMKTYENSVLGGWFIVSLFLIVRGWQRKMEIIGVAIMPIVLLMMGNGVMGDPVIEPLRPTFKSNWLWLHVFFAWIAYGAFCMGAAFGALYLLKERAERKGKVGGFLARLPELPVINDLTLKVIIFGFVALTVEGGAGALWAYDLWGRYWSWDPIETWSLITWLTYGTYIHLGVTLGWRGRRMAWLAIFAIIFEFITFGGIGYLGGVHTPIL